MLSRPSQSRARLVIEKWKRSAAGGVVILLWSAIGIWSRLEFVAPKFSKLHSMSWFLLGDIILVITLGYCIFSDYRKNYGRPKIAEWDRLELQ